MKVTSSARLFPAGYLNDCSGPSVRTELNLQQDEMRKRFLARDIQFPPEPSMPAPANPYEIGPLEAVRENVSKGQTLVHLRRFREAFPLLKQAVDHIERHRIPCYFSLQPTEEKRLYGSLFKCCREICAEEGLAEELMSEAEKWADFAADPWDWIRHKLDLLSWRVGAQRFYEYHPWEHRYRSWKIHEQNLISVIFESLPGYLEKKYCPEEFLYILRKMLMFPIRPGDAMMISSKIVPKLEENVFLGLYSDTQSIEALRLCMVASRRVLISWEAAASWAASHFGESDMLADAARCLPVSHTEPK